MSDVEQKWYYHAECIRYYCCYDYYDYLSHTLLNAVSGYLMNKQTGYMTNRMVQKKKKKLAAMQ